MRIGDWYYSPTRKALPQIKPPDQMGVVYIVRFEVMGKTSLVKIGATSYGNGRLSNFKGAISNLFCISKPHYNYFENEEILHNRFEKYRVPPRPGKGVSPELFNLTVPYIIANARDLRFETDLGCVEPVYLKNYTQPFYFAKQK